jgi:pterin-4a-carbinolamine dehydratase
MQPTIAKRQNESKVKAELEELVKGGWQLDDEQIQLEKTYYFASYRLMKVRNGLYILAWLTAFSS